MRMRMMSYFAAALSQVMLVLLFHVRNFCFACFVFCFKMNLFFFYAQDLSPASELRCVIFWGNLVREGYFVVTKPCICELML